MKKVITAQKELLKIRQQLGLIKKQIQSVDSVVIVEQRLRETQKENHYLRGEFRKLIDKYSRNQSTGAQSLCAKIKRIFYKIDESKEIDHREKRSI